MVRCELCESSEGVKYVAEMFGFNPGVHLCKVCRSCFWNDDKGTDLEFSVGKVAPLSREVMMPGFFSGQMMQKLIPRLLD